MAFLHVLEFSHHFKEFLAAVIELFGDSDLFASILLRQIIVLLLCVIVVSWTGLISFVTPRTLQTFYFYSYNIDGSQGLRKQARVLARSDTLMRFRNQTGWLVK